MMKNTLYFTLKALFIFKIFKFFILTVWSVEKRFDKKDKVNFKIYDMGTVWETINYNTHIAQYFKK